VSRSAPLAKSSSTPALAGRRVLVVEDEYFVADDLDRALKTLGAEVVGPFASREKALEAFISGEPFDIAVLDINLQGEAIYPVADVLLEAGVPFVFATGYDKASLPEPYRDIPRWEKPFDPGELAKALSGLKQLGAL
jgi:CheY-like chemotaxis protein